MPNIPPCYHVAYEFCEDSSETLKNKAKSLKVNPSDIFNDVQQIYFELIASPNELQLLKFSQRFHQLAKKLEERLTEAYQKIEKL